MSCKIYIISLPDADARRQQVVAQLGAFECSYEFVDAFDGAQGARLFEAVDTHKHLITTGRLPSPGEIGCYASHLGLWRKCVADGQPICVLEDDCHLEEFFPAALESASRLIGQYGFIRLQTEFRGKKRFIRDVDGFKLHRYTKMPHSTLAYLLAPSVASRFIAHSSIMTCPADIFIKLFWEHGASLYGLTPYAARESALASETSIKGRSRPRKDLKTAIARATAKANMFLRRTAFNRAYDRRERNARV